MQQKNHDLLKNFKLELAEILKTTTLTPTQRRQLALERYIPFHRVDQIYREVFNSAKKDGTLLSEAPKWMIKWMLNI